MASPFLTAYVRLKLLTGLRRGDLLSSKLSDRKEDGIHVTPRKTANSTGKRIIIQWSNELRLSVEEVRRLRKKAHSIWLFHTRQGQPYMKDDGTANGFDSIWQRFMKKALNETGLKDKFTEHDLRAKAASDTDFDHAKALLGHNSNSMTGSVYRRKPSVVQPLK